MCVMVLVLEVVFGKMVIFVEWLDCSVIDVVLVDVVILVENICFLFMEIENDLKMVGFLVMFGDVYCNDVFLVVYCVYVLMEGVVWLLLNCVGLLM